MKTVTQALKQTQKTVRKRAKVPLPTAGREGSTVLDPGGEVLYLPRLFPAAASTKLFTDLQTEVGWEARKVVILGQEVLQPRMVAYQADDQSLTYTYSRATLTPDPWSPAVAAIKRQVEQATGATFNSCLLNQYRSGDDHMGWHSDNEPLYGQHPVIGSVSFGEPRDFILRSNADVTRKVKFSLGHGDVLVMRGATQQHWSHSVPKRKGCGPRINLTFRTVVQLEQAGETAGAAVEEPEHEQLLPAPVSSAITHML